MSYPQNFKKIQNCVAQVLHIQKKEVELNSTLIHDLGADSLDITEIRLLLEEKFRREVSPLLEEKLDIGIFANPGKDITIRDICSLI